MKTFFALLIFISLYAKADECFSVDNPPRDYIEDHKISIRQTSLTANSKFTLFGDHHGNGGLENAFLQQLRKIKNEGVDILLMEMLPMDVEIKSQTPQEITKMLRSQGHDHWNEQYFSSIITEAKKVDLRVIGFFPDPTAIDKDWDELQKVHRERDLTDFSDLLYTRNILKIADENKNSRFAVLVGLAHTAGYYERSRIKTNSHLLGQLLYSGVSERDIRLIELQKSGIVGDISYLPLPKGRLPGCSELEAKSATDGKILYP